MVHLAPWKVKSDQWLLRYWGPNVDISKKQSNNLFDANFYHQGCADPKVMGTVESSLLRHLSDQTYSYGDIKCLDNSIGGAAAGGGGGVHYDSKVLTCIL